MKNYWLVVLTPHAIPSHIARRNPTTPPIHPRRIYYSNFQRKPLPPSLPLSLPPPPSNPSLLQLCGTLLVDLHPSRPATAQAALNLIRCSMSAAGLAGLQPLIDSVGVGWCYNIFGAVLGIVCLPLCLAEMRWGRVWRGKREET